mmetsp:Transcript_28667/g.42453  ORF Transcript_28667/g.42453 Transcript_28667/m.42453 type:complete len:422 (+) Transcript_28667:140-1405(+)|eukprot:CAMPEP_0195520842 /NCGR_PEP_ID=MMETSP0794_2-20130614/17577_1 /TAXON_ID=515487 /ORGANISM="Stephanopyxis turris, Strain CCMP 815" /LENGTH=421 /DNA_ID=CAMNT_0040650277 /DNA_START=140 /DNA_END=1405 /DNA_ORIENTATION=-
MSTRFKAVLGALAVAAPLAFSEDCTQIDVSGASLSASHDNTINSNEDYTRAFDSDVTTKWLVYEGVTESVWVQAVLDEAKTVTKYGITSANDAQERDPSSWTLLASNDGVYFVTLDEQLGVTWSEREQRQVFSLSNTLAYTYYRWEFNSVRDSATANSMQLNYISLFEGDCEDACCGIDCGDHGSCTEGTCECDVGYEGTLCSDISAQWGEYSGRTISGVTASTTTTASDIDACKTLCVEGNDDAACIGVNFNSDSSSCSVITGTSSGWTLKSASDGDNTVAAILVSENLLDSATPESLDVAEQVDYTVNWNPQYHQMPRIDMFIGESVTFEWEDVNMRNLPQYSAPNHHDIYLFAGEAQYQRCDFRGAKVIAVAPKSQENMAVTWTSTTTGTYYFGSNYGTDCSVGQLKMIVQVKRRPSP